MGIVFDGPVHRVTRQPVPAGQGPDAAIPDDAEPALCRRPERAVGVEVKSSDAPCAEPMARGGARVDPPVDDVRDPAVDEPEPDAALAIRDDRGHDVVASE